MPDKNTILTTLEEMEEAAKRVLGLADRLEEHLLAAKLDDCLQLIDMRRRQLSA